MSRILTVASGKGGVGKTTTTVNLGSALAGRGKNVIIVDANVTTPNIGLHLGIPLYPVTLHDVLNGNATVEEAIYIHPSGFKIVPSSLSGDAMKNAKPEALIDAIRNLYGRADIVLVDGAAGLGKEAKSAIEAADEILIVTNPELPAVTDALKTIKYAERHGKHVIGVVVNRVKGSKSELSLNEIRSMLDKNIVSAVPEDSNVSESISIKVPVVNYKPGSKASTEFKKLAAHIVGERFVDDTFLGRFFKWLV